MGPTVHASKPTVCQISRVDDKLVVIDCPCKTVDSSMVQRRIDLRNDVPLRLISLDGKTIGAVNAQVDDSIDREWCLVTRHTWAEEMLHGRVRRYDLIVVGCSRCQAGKSNRVGVRSRCGIRHRIC